MDLNRIDKIVFWTSLGMLCFFLMLFATFRLKIDFIMLGVVRELFTIPLMLGEWLFLFWAVRSFIRQGYPIKSYAFGSVMVLVTTIALSWGSLFIKV